MLGLITKLPTLHPLFRSQSKEASLSRSPSSSSFSVSPDHSPTSRSLLSATSKRQTEPLEEFKSESILLDGALELICPVTAEECSMCQVHVQIHPSFGQCDWSQLRLCVQSDCGEFFKVQPCCTASTEYPIEFSFEVPHCKECMTLTVLHAGSCCSKSSVSVRSSCQSSETCSDCSSVKTWGSFGVNNGCLYNPFSVSVSSSNEVFVCNSGTHSIHVFNRNGEFLRKFGKQGRNPGELRNPCSIVVSGKEVYVTEQGNNRVSVFRTDGTFLRCWGTSSDCQFSFPWGIDVDKDLVYVAQHQGHCVQVFNKLGQFQYQWSDRDNLQSPAGIKFHNGYVYIANYDLGTVSLFSADGKFVQSFGDGPGENPSQLDCPTSVCISKDGVCISEFENHRISMFDFEGRFLKSIGGYGTKDSEFDGIYGICMGTNESLYVCDYSGHRIQVISL